MSDISQNSRSGGHEVTSDRLRALAEFVAVFEASSFKAGEMVLSNAEPGLVRMPYACYSAEVGAFVAAAYENGWVLRSFDWPSWAQSEEAIRLRDSEAALAEATSEQLMRLLTICIRQSRFVEGALLTAFETGLIQRIVRRAAALIDNDVAARQIPTQL